MPTLITTAPYTISTPGSYRLGANLNLSGNGSGIAIAADNVTVDLDGYAIVHSGAANSSGKSILTSGARNSIAVVNGRLSGGYAPIWLGDGNYNNLLDANGPANFHIENIMVDRALFRGIRLEARSATVRNCHISNVTGCTLYSNAYCFGIELYGAGSDLQNNSVFNVAGMGDTGEGVGIIVAGFGDGARIKGNLITNEQRLARSSYGIFVGGYETNASKAVMRDNDIVSWQTGIAVSSGNDAAYEDNTFIDCANDYQGDVDFDAGSNFTLA